MITGKKTSIYFDATALEEINAFIGDKPIESIKDLVLYCIRNTASVTPVKESEEYLSLKRDFDLLAENQKKIVEASRETENEKFHLEKVIADLEKEYEGLESQFILLKAKQSITEKDKKNSNKKIEVKPLKIEEKPKSSIVLPINLFS